MPINSTTEVSTTTLGIEPSPASDQSAQVQSARTFLVHNDAVFKSEAPVPSEPPQESSQQPLAGSLPPLDLSSLTQSSRVSEDPHVPSRVKKSASKQQQRKTATPTPKKARVRNYADHFARANANLTGFPDVFPDSMHAPPRAQEIQWNGAPIRVKVVAGNAPTASRINTGNKHKQHDTASTSPPYTKEEDLMLQNVVELQQLMRIRPHPDGFREREVNAGCTFTPLTSPSSSSSSEEEQQPLSSSSFSEDEALPVFHRGDRVLFRARQRRFKGIIARRIRKSNFYDVKAANGTVFLTISAMRIRLLPEEEERYDEVPEHYNFQRGDRVLWQDLTPTRQTYKARIVRPRSLNRFDIQLRTGRIVPKVPYEELRPRSYDT
uniref:SGF29 C-terminal domain-containing protein n=1 Tax=Globisporangium ultimum (strain ATCC 200006 / CBS 805.95 / DAOM BR144) TaxID=431595 RepID=K3X847_GLOUD